MFSLLKRCKYSLYSDTMLNIGCIECVFLMIDTFPMKQTRMYICTLEEFISSRCSHIAVHG